MAHSDVVYSTLGNIMMQRSLAIDYLRALSELDEDGFALGKHHVYYERLDKIDDELNRLRMTLTRQYTELANAVKASYRFNPYDRGILPEAETVVVVDHVVEELLKDDNLTDPEIYEILSGQGIETTLVTIGIVRRAILRLRRDHPI